LPSKIISSIGAVVAVELNVARVYTAAFVIYRDRCMHQQHIYLRKCSIVKCCVLIYD